MNVYIHIPFCHSKCAYCAFLSHCDIQKEDKYISAVCLEIASRRLDLMDNINTIYLGGGTPSLINPENITKIIDSIKSKSRVNNNVEITLECNPEDICMDKLKKWKAAGINRLSIGIQSLNNNTRDKIKRHLSAKESLSRITLAQKYFTNIGVDIISGLPEETNITLLRAIDIFATLGVDHISLYDLETDNSSLIGQNIGRYNLPSDDGSASMLFAAWTRLQKLGYEQYEISNFAKNQKYCQHNLSFWNGYDYVGFGLGASSRQGNKITKNTDDFSEYISGQSKYSDTEVLTTTETNRLDLISAMRLNGSFEEELSKYRTNFIIPNELLDGKFMTRDLCLTPKGKLVYNQVIDRLLNYE